MLDTKYMTSKVKKAPEHHPSNRNAENGKTTDELHHSGFFYEVIALKSRLCTIIIVLCGIVDVMPGRPGGQSPRPWWNVNDALFFEVRFDQGPCGRGVRCRVACPTTEATPITAFEANAGILELGHFDRFHDPPLGWRAFAS